MPNTALLFPNPGNMYSTSPRSMSPVSGSPDGSCSSTFSQSSEDLLDDRSPITSLQSLQATNLQPRYSHYDNFEEVKEEINSGQAQQQAQKEINELTLRMKELTSKLDEGQGKGHWEQGQGDYDNYPQQETNLMMMKTHFNANINNPPPLPMKVGNTTHRRTRSERIHSQYDNISPVPGHPETAMLVQVPNSAKSGVQMRTSQSAVTFSTGKGIKTTTVHAAHSKSTHMMLSHETFSSREMFSSADMFCGSSEGGQPPPLPPKKRFGKWFAQEM